MNAFSPSPPAADPMVLAAPGPRRARDITGAGGGKGGGSGGGVSEAPNTLRTKATAMIVDIIGEGPILGLVDEVEGGTGEKSIYLDDVAVQNEDGSYNHKDFFWAIREGDPDQAHMEGFPSVEAEVAVGVKVTVASPVVRTISDPDIDAILVTARFPALATQGNGAIVGTTIHFKIERRASGGGWVTIHDITLNDKNTSPADLQWRVPKAAAPWDVRMVRVTPDSNSTLLQNETHWAAYTEIKDRKLTYRNTAVVGSAADAEKFGGRVPARAYECYLRIVKVPSNYDPWTRTYDGIWDGTFKSEWTDNPAWVFYDMVDNDRYGVRRLAPSVLIDKWMLYEVAKYSDGLVPDGMGGMEPRFTFNGHITSEAQAHQLLQAIAATFRGYAYYMNGMVTATQDRPSDPVALVSRDNVIDGHIAYPGTALASRPTVVVVSWNDPADGYRIAYEVVELPEKVARFGMRKAQISGFGITRRSEAVRKARWVLDEAWNSTEGVNYLAGLDHALVEPGRILAVNDSRRAGVRFAGRIVAATTTSIEIDAPVTLEGGEYTVSIMAAVAGEDKPVILTRTLNNDPGVTSVLTWDTALDEAPPPFWEWAISGGGVVAKQFRCIGVDEQGALRFAVEGLFHDPNKYARIEQNLVLPPISYSTLPTGKLGAPGVIRPDVQDTIEGGALVRSLLVSWAASADPRANSYEAEARRPGTDHWERFALAPTLSGEIRPAIDGAWGFRVRARDSLGGSSEWTVNDPVTINMSTDPPAAVTGFFVDATNGIGRAQWDTHPDGDVLTAPGKFEIKFSPDTVAPSWDAAMPVPGPTIPGRANEASVPLRSGSYLIKAVDIDGNYSIAPAIFITTLPDLVGRNVMATLDEAPAWLGLKTNTVVVDGALLLDTADLVSEWPLISSLPSITYAGGVVSSGSYVGGILDLGAVYQAVRLIATVAVQTFNPLDTIGSREAPISTWESITGAVLADVARAVLDVRVTQDDPYDPGAVWSEWQPFLIGEFQGRGFQPRLRKSTSDPAYNLRTAQMSLQADVHDRVEHTVVTTGTGADTAWNFAAFAATPTIGHSIAGAAPGDHLDLVSVTPSGVTACVRNAAGARIARSLHLTALGFGKVV